MYKFSSWIRDFILAEKWVDFRSKMSMTISFRMQKRYK